MSETLGIYVTVPLGSPADQVEAVSGLLEAFVEDIRYVLEDNEALFGTGWEVEAHV